MLKSAWARLTIACSVSLVLILSACGGGGGSSGSGSGSGGFGSSAAQPPLIIMGGTSNQALSLTTAVTTIAGNGISGEVDNTTGTSAEFQGGWGITSDGTNLYVTDYSGNTVRKIVIATGAVTTIAGNGTAGELDNATGTSAEFDGPMGITTDGTNLYVTDTSGNKIRKIVIATGAVTTIAGNGIATELDNTTGTSAEFENPAGITTDGTNLYVADYLGGKIRKIVIATGAVTTVAGNGIAGELDNTIGTLAEFNNPHNITTDGSNLYVTDSGGSTIRKIVIATGAVTTLAGNGTAAQLDNATGTLAEFNYPQGITTDGTNLYVTDLHNANIRKIVIATSAVTTLAGNGTAAELDNTTGTSAEFDGPASITTNGTSLYVTDYASNKIRKIN